MMVETTAASKLAVPNILLVEDDPAHVKLIEYAMEEGRVQAVTHVAQDGAMALGMVHECEAKSADLPDLILLDLNLPRVDGRVVLETLKTDKRFQTIPVLILSSSTHEDDIDWCYHHGANAYHAKPNDFTGLVGLMESIDDYWLKKVCRN